MSTEYGKKQQSKLYREQEQERHVWMSQNLNPRKTAAIVTIWSSWWRLDHGKKQEG